MRKNTLNYLLNIDLLIAGLSLIVLVIITFLGVIMRYIFNAPFVWLEEVQLWCAVWLVFFGASAAFRSGSHVSIEFVVDRFQPPLKKLAEIFAYFVVVSGLVYLMVYGIRLIEHLHLIDRTTNVLKVPYTIIYSAIPIGCALMIINYSIIMYESFFFKKK